MGKSGESIPGRRNSKCKGPEAATCPGQLRVSQEAAVAGAQWEEMSSTD